ncbi:MAG: Flavodoxin reductases (ferredoxin-NADPH reductases) family 1 [uncultured Solirubrobacteraceae bacterium]|uniref:Flavodoxin reductases (Ferredoxin-NADPH reductases) family 1 n=1 Tax=uncultured Solirubrobacteraceae bacterium TaxID=1162706 RepID=A0A6J4TQF2_9ACTN|nr:MAG: Flavodoxin reductases (ferredoxin-NADPH reductases) family 1 [uncultured Solirubrobacteraceae bacterium]
MRAFFTPLLPDDYLELINPLWSTRELRGRVERVERETDDTRTIVIRPGWEWPGHEPGQYLRVGVIVDGVHHWRAYSLTSDPGREDGCISITPKLVPEGKVSPHLVEQTQPGSIVRLGGVEGTFKLPDEPPEKVLFLSAGSGVTPIMAMLRCLERQDALSDVVHLHSARTAGDVIFGDRLRAIAERHPGYRLHERHTGADPRLGPGDLDTLCPDWRERETFMSGPAELLDAMAEHWEAHGNPERLHMERFQPTIGGDAEAGEGGTVCFKRSGTETECDGGTPILVAGEEAGLELEFGCRMGICHTCVGRLSSGRVRDLRTGEILQEGETVRICISAPEGPVALEL